MLTPKKNRYPDGSDSCTGAPKRASCIKRFKSPIMIFLQAFLFMTAGMAQTTTTFPPLSSCTSKDLELVSATLTGGNACNSCTPGDSLTRNLTLGINNKTGSTRTAFAFWGTLEITSAADGQVRTFPISRCSGPIPSTGPLPASYTGGNFGTIKYACGDALRLVNLYLAWTDASPKSTCATINSATINPKCGTLPSIQINAGVNGSFSNQNITCFGSTGSIDLTPFGGTPYKVGAPYRYLWSSTNSTIPSGQSANQDLTGVAAGTYTVRITDSLGCFIEKTTTITGPSGGLSLGTCSKTDVSCFGATNGSVSAGAVSNNVGTINYVWKKGTVTVGTTASVNNLGAGTYVLTVSDNCSSQSCTVVIGGPSAALALGTCSKTDVTCYGGTNGTVTAGTVTNNTGTIHYSWKNASNTEVGTNAGVSNLPAGDYTLTVSDDCSSQTCTVTIGGPTAALALGTCSKTDVSCSGGDGTVSAGTVSNHVGTVNYVWKKGTTTVGTTANLTNLDAGTYILTVTDDCSSQTCSVTVGAPPALTTPAATVTRQPNCSTATGTVTVTSPDAAITYTLEQSGQTKYTAVSGVFNLVEPGTYTLKASSGICSTTGNNVTVNPQPSTPGTPAVCIKQVSLCSTDKGAVSFESLGAGYEYSIKDGAEGSWSSCNVFLNLGIGEVTGLRVRNSAGCVSPAANCNTICTTTLEACPSQTLRTAQRQEGGVAEEQQLKLTAYPNPFNDKISFILNSPLTGAGSLEVYNALGQKVKTVFQGTITKGTQNFELRMPVKQQANLIYVLRVGDKQLTGKILQLNQ